MLVSLTVAAEAHCLPPEFLSERSEVTSRLCEGFIGLRCSESAVDFVSCEEEFALADEAKTLEFLF